MPLKFLYKATDMKKLFMMAPLIVALAACNASSSSTVTLPDGKGGQSKIETPDKGTATITAADGSKTTVSSDASKIKLPDYAPAYPGSTLHNVSSFASDKGAMTTASLTSSDSADKIIGFYKTKLAAVPNMPIGLESITSTSSMILAGDVGMPGMSGQGFIKGLSATINVVAEEGHNKIDIVLQTPKN
jgi:hypothetical protein